MKAFEANEKVFLKEDKKWEKEAYEKTTIYNGICRVFDNFIKDVNKIDRNFRHSVGEKIYILLSEVVINYKRGYSSTVNEDKVKYWKKCFQLLEDINSQLKLMATLKLSFSYGVYCIDMGNLERQLVGLISKRQELIEKESMK